MRVLEYPNPALRQTASEVDPSDHDLPRLIEQMTRVMAHAPGVGLAATQLGVQKRVIVFRADEDGEANALLNPVITSSSVERSVEEEGCLSIPGIAIPIERSARVVCEGVSPHGELVRIEADDGLARILQHEVDHLDGTVIIDRVTAEERRATLRRYRELRELKE